MKLTYVILYVQHNLHIISHNYRKQFFFFNEGASTMLMLVIIHIIYG